MKPVHSPSILTLLLIFHGVTNGQDPVPVPLKVLFIGNSYTAANNLPVMLEGLADAAGGQKIHTDRHLVGGCTLERHFREKKAIDKITAEKWDVVVLQEQSLRPVLDRQSMHKYARLLDAEIGQQGAKTIFYLTWARRHIPEMQEGADPATSPGFARAMHQIGGSAKAIDFDAWCQQQKNGLQGGLNGAYFDIARELGSKVAPVGIAWKNARAANPPFVLHRPDKSHPNPTGTYLAACVFYVTLLDKSPVGLPSVVKQGDKVLVSIPDDEAKRLQEIAWAAVREVPHNRAAADMEFVRVANDNRSFVLDKSGREFIPWGFNYDHDGTGRLIEDYWDDEWPMIVEDFREMKELGATVIRIHLQFGKFMKSADEPNQHSLQQLARLLKLAEEVELYLDLTGLGCYHKKDVPSWYDELEEEERWKAQAAFWQAVAKTCADNPVIFCYDLMNEPVIGGAKKRDDWLGNAFAGKHFVQFIVLETKSRPRHEIARRWTGQLVAAIRKHDRRHLVTIGLVPWSLNRPGLTSGFVPEKIADELDFIAMHIYPEKGKLDEAMKTVKGFAAAGKPVVIEETFPLKCSPDEMGGFIDESKSIASGWISFYWGKTPKECRKGGTIGDAIMADWLELFPRKMVRIVSKADEGVVFQNSAEPMFALDLAQIKREGFVVTVIGQFLARQGQQPVVERLMWATLKIICDVFADDVIEVRLAKAFPSGPPGNSSSFHAHAEGRGRCHFP